MNGTTKLTLAQEEVLNKRPLTVLARNIQAYLRQNRKSLHELSRDANVALSSLHDWTWGAQASAGPPLKRLADYMGTTVDELVYETEKESHVS